MNLNQELFFIKDLSETEQKVINGGARVGPIEFTTKRGSKFFIASAESVFFNKGPGIQINTNPIVQTSTNYFDFDAADG